MTNRQPNPDAVAEATPQEVRRVALNLLARREHSLLELHHKLNRRGFAPALIATVLEQLVAEDLLNEHRYAELYAHSRVDKGYGPLRVQRELRERGVPATVVAAVLADLEDLWIRKLTELHRKRFGAVLPKDAVGQARQIRFLRYRGFTPEQINHLFRDS
jgi:regulatory protein